MKMKMGNLMLYVLLGVLVILLVTSLVMNLTTAVRDHEFITDLISIKPPKGSDLLNAMCYLHKCPDSSSQECDNLNKLKIPNVFKLIGLVSNKVTKDACASLSQDEINNILALYTFDKLEATQILNNNFEYINYIYSHKDTKACMKDLFGIFTAAMVKYPGSQQYKNAVQKASDKFADSYKKLKTRDRKYINIVLKNTLDLELVYLL